MRRYDARTDLGEMNGWYRARGLHEVRAEDLPIVGYIVPGVAAGFVYTTDSSLRFIDGLISNPAVPSKDRYEALNAIGERLVSDFHGKRLLIYTSNAGIARWSREHDFAARDSHQLFERT